MSASVISAPIATPRRLTSMVTVPRCRGMSTAGCRERQGGKDPRWGRLQRAAVGKHAPECRPLAPHALEHLGKIAEAGLAPAMIFDQTAKRLEMDCHGREHAD